MLPFEELSKLLERLQEKGINYLDFPVFSDVDLELELASVDV